jgi:hypothetical protein
MTATTKMSYYRALANLKEEDEKVLNGTSVQEKLSVGR